MQVQGLFSIFGNVARGLSTELTRLETVSENISNANMVAGQGEPIYHRKTVDPKAGKEPFRSMLRSKRLSLRRSEGSHLKGVNERHRWFSKPWPEVKTIEHPNERVVYDPVHPKADASGFVRMPDVNVVDEMMQMITATRSYEANTAVLTAAKTLARKTLEI
ncbi:MAG: flagellar basal body rod C-terminal domain-containing protein [Candidatus Neomarinimicrobiota bacterium]